MVLWELIAVGEGRDLLTREPRGCPREQVHFHPGVVGHLCGRVGEAGYLIFQGWVLGEDSWVAGAGDLLDITLPWSFT